MCPMHYLPLPLCLPSASPSPLDSWAKAKRTHQLGKEKAHAHKYLMSVQAESVLDRREGSVEGAGECVEGQWKCILKVSI